MLIVSLSSTGLQHMRLRIHIGYFLIGATYVITVSAILGGCGTTFRKNWQIYPNPGSLSICSIHLKPLFCRMTDPFA